jgi:dsRNA-specific ribonuclease
MGSLLTRIRIKDMKDNYREFYQLVCTRHLGDGLYVWEDVDNECDTLEQCLDCMSYAQDNPEYTDFSIEFRTVTELYKIAEFLGDN